MDRRLVLSSALVAAVLAAPSAMAFEGQATGVSYEGGIRHAGDLALLNIIESVDREGLNDVLGLQLDASSAWGQFHEREALIVPGASLEAPSAGPETIADEGQPLQGVALDAIARVSQVQINVFAWDGAAQLAMKGPKAVASSASGAYLSGNGLETGSGVGDRDPRAEDQTTFTPRSVDHPIILARSQDQTPHTVEITGDFVVEIMGLHVALDADDYASEFRTGEESESTAAGAVTQGYARLLRLFVQDGVLEFDLKKTDAKVAYALTGGVASSESGTATFRDITTATGFQATSVLRGPFVIEERPSDAGLAVTAQSPGAPGPDASPMASLAAAPATGWIVGGAIILAVIAIVVREFRAPNVQSIEYALESGHYRKAARLSTRILRHDPLDESAQLSRAIAWSRVGRQGRVVRVLEPFLERHEPSDGTIHYVLGLARHDLGQVDEARDAMAEAVRRTPSLLGEVAGDLRPRAAGHSDAHAYT